MLYADTDSTPVLAEGKLAPLALPLLLPCAPPLESPYMNCWFM